MIRLAWMTVAVALLVGCGEDRLRDIRDPAPDDGPASPPDAAPELRRIPVELRLRGSGADGFSSLLVVADQVQVLVDGAPVEVQRRSGLVDLAAEDHAERIATFSVPATATRVEFKIELGAAGGFEQPGARGWLDTRQTSLEFRSPVSELARTGRAVAVIDLSRSLIEREGHGYLLMPQFRVY